MQFSVIAFLADNVEWLLGATKASVESAPQKVVPSYSFNVCNL